jgi:hypothetical protein
MQFLCLAEKMVYLLGRQRCLFNKRFGRQVTLGAGSPEERCRFLSTLIETTFYILIDLPGSLFAEISWLGEFIAQKRMGFALIDCGKPECLSHAHWQTRRLTGCVTLFRSSPAPVVVSVKTSSSATRLPSITAILPNRKSDYSGPTRCCPVRSDNPLADTRCVRNGQDRFPTISLPGGACGMAVFPQQEVPTVADRCRPLA